MGNACNNNPKKKSAKSRKKKSPEGVTFEGGGTPEQIHPPLETPEQIHPPPETPQESRPPPKNSRNSSTLEEELKEKVKLLLQRINQLLPRESCETIPNANHQPLLSSDKSDDVASYEEDVHRVMGGVQPLGESGVTRRMCTV